MCSRAELISPSSCLPLLSISIVVNTSSMARGRCGRARGVRAVVTPRSSAAPYSTRSRGAPSTTVKVHSRRAWPVLAGSAGGRVESLTWICSVCTKSCTPQSCVSLTIDDHCYVTIITNTAHASHLPAAAVNTA